MITLDKEDIWIKFRSVKKVRSAIRHILIENQAGFILSSGTGVVVKPDGTLITAKHVIEGEGGIYNGQIIVRGPETEQKFYQPVITGFSFDINSPDLISPISVDLTIIQPVNKQDSSDFIPLATDIAEVGTDVLIAGFPDDINLPLNFLEKLNTDNPEISIIKRKIDTHIKYFFRQLMFKSAMIGHVQKIQLNNVDVSAFSSSVPAFINIAGATFWIDNHLTYGGSGGPIVNLNGELVGIVCEKAFTDSKMENPKKFPSGTGMGLSHHLISWLF